MKLFKHQRQAIIARLLQKSNHTENELTALDDKGLLEIAKQFGITVDPPKE